MPNKRSAATGASQGAGSSSTSASERATTGTPGSSVVDEAKDKAQEVASQAQDKASQQLHAGMSKGKTRAADTLGAVAQSLLISSQQLREQDRGTVGGVVEKAANRVENWANYMRNTDAREMADRVEGFARREPAIFLGGAFALGLLGARFLKSSRREESDHPRYQASRGPQGRQFTRPRDVMSDREVPISRTPY